MTTQEIIPFDHRWNVVGAETGQVWVWSGIHNADLGHDATLEEKYTRAILDTAHIQSLLALTGKVEPVYVIEVPVEV